MKLAVITLILSLCLMVSMAYPEPYMMHPRPQAGAQKMPAAASYPYMQFDGAKIAQLSPDEVRECANKKCTTKGKSKCFNPLP